MAGLKRCIGGLAFFAAARMVWAAVLAPFQFPTANHYLLEPGGEDKFLVGTVGRDYRSGGFGCVRSEGHQFHEGLDIRCLQRDKRGEPVDPVLATAAGAVSYINRRAGLSNYGNYIILRHRIEGLEVYSLYAHLREIAPNLREGHAVLAGEEIGVMGRTANTRSGISRERAHVHFELTFLVNERFPAWYKRRFPGQRNDHGVWNGQNLLGIDPRRIFLAEHQQGANFRFLNAMRHETELCRVLVRATDFSWLRRNPALIQPNPVAAREGVVGYEMALTFDGLPFALIPRAASEIKGAAKVQLLSVNEAEQKANPCRRLVTRKGSRWVLTARGMDLLDLLTY